ncbi:MAG: sugar phosphate isomerase/epimerase [Pirellulales bacterium]|nr:sugar phosphate isomerase/epimerase [Pirellulales bacterium]
MQHRSNRRAFLKATGMGAAGLTLGSWLKAEPLPPENPLPPGAAPSSAKVSPAEQLGWRLGCQVYTFRSFSFFEAVEKTALAGMRYIEAHPGQRLSKDNPARMGVGLDKDTRQEVKRRLAEAGVAMVNFGVCRLGKDEAESRKTFDFAKDMGIETLVSEPSEDAFDTLDKLCNEYEINLAIHNHPKPSHYWDYRTVLAACKDRSKRVGACCDTGHWMRSGIQPFEAVRALEGRIISFHLKDLNEFGKMDAHDVPWGTGKAGIRQLLQELRRQRFQGVFSIEYEHETPQLLDEVAQCARYFDSVTEGLSASN